MLNISINSNIRKAFLIEEIQMVQSNFRHHFIILILCIDMVVISVRFSRRDILFLLKNPELSESRFVE